MLIVDQFKKQARSMIGKPYLTDNRHIACIMLVLELTAPYSAEIQKVMARLKRMQISHNKKNLILQDYFNKFIRSTRLERIEGLINARTGDILLINGYSREEMVDHLGLYIGDGEYIHLQRNRRQDVVELGRVDDDRQKILGIVRADDYGRNIWA
jgi:cell wall-associated NlpC family hydrolase